mmetsp:Transcript_10318/g.32580  ORF Transcript_10318/g.32580 Transcript_10318/m.32580 type:complete len:255 (+) Transcript_10318:119-883(+)
MSSASPWRARARTRTRLRPARRRSRATLSRRRRRRSAAACSPARSARAPPRRARCGSTPSKSACSSRRRAHRRRSSACSSSSRARRALAGSLADSHQRCSGRHHTSPSRWALLTPSRPPLPRPRACPPTKRCRFGSWRLRAALPAQSARSSRRPRRSQRCGCRRARAVASSARSPPFTPRAASLACGCIPPSFQTCSALLSSTRPNSPRTSGRRRCSRARCAGASPPPCTFSPRSSPACALRSHQRPSTWPRRA